MTGEFVKKLVSIQKNLNAPKGKKNTFGNYNYRSAEDILEAAKPLAHKEDLALIVTDDIVVINDRTYVKATAMITDGDSVAKANGFAREAETKKGMDDAQITGSASSYARKYALGGLLAIDDTKDPDGYDNRDSKPTAPKKQAPVAPKQPTPIDELAKAKKELQEMLTAYGHNNQVKMKIVIKRVLEKNTVDTVEEANEVMQALTDGAV